MSMNYLKKQLKKIKFIRSSVRFFFKVKKRLHLASTEIGSIEPVYSRERPSNQTMVDILKGCWTSAFPDEYNAKAGKVRHFDFSLDWRVQWVDQVLPGGIKGLSVLELGAFEAYNTWHFEKLGARSVASIEGNNLNFLKCLIVKEITGLNARFLYGDIIAFLESHSQKYDLLYASGVLYHSTEPLKLLNLMTMVTGKLFLYTHYYDENAINCNPFLSDSFYPDKDVEGEINGYKAKLHYKSYNEKKDITFCGGSEDFSFWMEKQNILEFLELQGFKIIKTRLDQLDNPHGPVLFIFAEKIG
jgi:hypothetical protein